MRKKLMHIVEGFGGGVFTFLVDLINLTSNDYDITLVCAIRPQTPSNYKEYFSDDIEIIELKNASREIDVFKDIKLLFEMKDIVKKIKPDIIHLHSSKAGFLGRLICSDKKMNVIYNPHGYSFLKDDESKLKKNIYKLLEYSVSKKCGKIVAVSKGEYEEALKLSKNSYLINNGVDINKLPKLKEVNFDANNIKICTIGRISYQKNPELFNEIAKKFPNFEFTWIGDGDMKECLKSTNISITGWKSKNEALNIMNDSNIFILTSLWEGLPIALLEAMYYKKVCIVSNCIGNRDVIKSNENGYSASNLEEFVSIIKKIARGDINVNFIKENANKDIIKNYNFDIVVEKYKEIYNK